jgi:hypothetical protein
MKIKVEASRLYHPPERCKMKTQVEVGQMIPRICFYAQLEMANGRHGILLQVTLRLRVVTLRMYAAYHFKTEHVPIFYRRD